MFEGPIPSVPPPVPAEAGALNAFAWPELVAKLAAARDFRAVLAGAQRGSLASFAPHAARALAGRDAGERPVNPDGLGRGKDPRAKPVAAADEAGQCDREMQ